MKFFAPTEQAVHIALVTGHTAVVTSEGSELDKMFHREAIARGCTPEGVEREPAAQTGGGFERGKVIREALNAMLDGKDEADFKKDGTPDLRMVSKRVGFQVQRDEVDAIWAEMQDAAA